MARPFRRGDNEQGVRGDARQFQRESTMKKIHFPFAVWVAWVLPLSALGATETVNGIEWEYEIGWEDEGSTLNGPTDKTLAGDVMLPSVLGGKVVQTIGQDAFTGCTNLTKVTIPEGVTSISRGAFENCPRLGQIVFLGDIPYPVSQDGFNELFGEYQNCRVTFSEAYGAKWHSWHLCDYWGIFMNYEHEPLPQVDILSLQIRETDPTILDVVYKVTSPHATANVRALAFEDGERSLAKVVRPETFVEGTEANLGDGIAANVEHTLSWRVSADWAVDLAKVGFEILVSDEGQLPVELVTIPAAGTNAEMTINVRQPREDDLFNALLWHYANHAEDLTVVDGELKHGGTLLAKNDCPVNTTDPIAYVYDKMGYDLLIGNALEYARMATRWSLSNSLQATSSGGNEGCLQYGVLRAAGE